jgi:hypothetical protein
MRGEYELFDGRRISKPRARLEHMDENLRLHERKVAESLARHEALREKAKAAFGMSDEELDRHMAEYNARRQIADN